MLIILYSINKVGTKVITLLFSVAPIALKKGGDKCLYDSRTESRFIITKQRAIIINSAVYYRRKKNAPAKQEHSLFIYYHLSMPETGYIDRVYILLSVASETVGERKSEMAGVGIVLFYHILPFIIHFHIAHSAVEYIVIEAV